MPLWIVHFLKILAEIVCLFFTSVHSKTLDLVNEISRLTPLDFNFEKNCPFCSYEIKRFLKDSALGMMPSKVWTGEPDLTGVYLLVKEEGEVLCCFISNRNECEDYLLNNTKLESASSTRHNFGTVFRKDSKQFF